MDEEGAGGGLVLGLVVDVSIGLDLGFVVDVVAFGALGLVVAAFLGGGGLFSAMSSSSSSRSRLRRVVFLALRLGCTSSTDELSSSLYFGAAATV